MSKRYVCMICHNEIPHRGAECPYCKSRSVIAEGASLRILVTVFGVMVCIFALTGLFSRSFKIEGRDRGRTHFVAAEEQMSRGMYERAINQYRDALLYSRYEPTYRLGLARALYAAQRYSESETYLLELRGGDPTSGIINLLLARLAAREGRIDESVSYFRTAIHGQWNVDPDEYRLQVRLELVDLLEKHDRQRLLTAELLELVEIDPGDRSVRHRLASLLLASQVLDRASVLFASLIATDPDDRAAILGRAEAEFRLRHYFTARTLYERALLLAEDVHTAESADLCNQILELDPTVRGIDLRERFRRSRLLVERAKSAFEACRNPLGAQFMGPLGPLEPEQADVLERADDALGARRPRPTVAGVESNVQLASRLWAQAKPLCGTGEPPDQPLKHVMEDLSR